MTYDKSGEKQGPAREARLRAMVASYDALGSYICGQRRLHKDIKAILYELDRARDELAALEEYLDEVEI